MDPIMDLARLQALIELVASSLITELDLTEGDVRVRISKAGHAPAATGEARLPAVVDAGAAASAPMRVPAPASVVRAPIAGTFFTTPSASDPPFVRPGESVMKGNTICIIEAMKTLTRVPSDHGGTLLKVLAASGAFVEFDQPLFEIG